MTFFGGKPPRTAPSMPKKLAPGKGEVDRPPSTAGARAQGAAKPPLLPTVADVLGRGDVAGSVAQIGDFMRSFDSRHRQQLNHALVMLYALAERLRQDEDARSDFCRNPIWASAMRNRAKLDRPELMLRYTLRLANGLNDDAGSKRASRQFRALGPFFEQGVPHTAIGQRLRAPGGVDRLARDHAKPREERASTKIGRCLVLNPGPRTAFLDEQRVGQEFSIQLKVTAVRNGVVHADIARTGRPKIDSSE